MVEWKKLGEVCTFCKGRSLSKNDIGFGDAKIILYGELYTTYGDYITDVKSRTSYEKAKLATKLNYGDLVLPISSTTKEAQIGKVSVIKLDGVSLGSDALILRGSFNPEYIMYFLNSKVFEKDKMNCVHGTTIMHLSPQKLAQKVIPIPPLSEQQRIVDILDTFTNSIENLKKQISHRRKQYEYYRDHLLNLQGKEGVEMKTLGDEIISLKTGLNPRKNFVLNAPNSNIPYITGKEIFNNSINVTDKTDRITKEALNLINKRACLENNLILFASTGTGTVGRMAVVDEYNGDWGMSETLYSIKMKSGYIPKYIMYCLYSDSVKKQYEPKISKGSVPHLKVVDLLNVKIPVLPLSEQERIVAILDQFEASIENLEKQLREREKQYEYYRDRLLRF